MDGYSWQREADLRRELADLLGFEREHTTADGRRWRLLRSASQGEPIWVNTSPLTTPPEEEDVT